MLLVDRQSGTAAAQCGSAGSAQLRFRADGQLVELPLGKTTIGSGPRCDLRIEGPGIAPVHCLIVRGAEGLSVRRWAVDTQLNGLQFNEAPLAVGDCLSLAGVELELVGPQPMIAAPAPNADSANGVGGTWTSVAEQFTGETGDLNAAVREGDSTVAQSTAEVESSSVGGSSPSFSDGAEIVFRQLRAACEVSRGRNWKLLAALRAERDQKCKLAQQLAEAGDELASLSRERAEWEQARLEDAKERSELEIQIQGLRLEVGDLEARLADQTRQLTERELELEHARSSALIEAVAATNDQPANQMVRSIGMTDDSGADIDSRNSPEETETGLAEVVERTGDRIASGNGTGGWPEMAPRLGEISHLLADEPVDERGSDVAAANDDEESIELYMAKLLQRVRGELPVGDASGQPAATKRTANETALAFNSTAAKTLAPAPLQLTTSSAIEPEEEEEDDVEVQVDWDAIARRAAASATDLGPLRALANETARCAINRHALTKHRRDAATKVIVATLAGMTSLWLMLGARNWLDIQFIIACVSLMVAVYWAGEACCSLVESLRVAGYYGPDAELDDAESHGQPAPPIDMDASR